MAKPDLNNLSYVVPWVNDGFYDASNASLSLGGLSVDYAAIIMQQLNITRYRFMWTYAALPSILGVKGDALRCSSSPPARPACRHADRRLSSTHSTAAAAPARTPRPRSCRGGSALQMGRAT